MALRGKKPKSHPPRLKALMFGPAGVGKTTAAIQMPSPYVIDTEDGCAHYGDIIESSGGAVFESNDIEEVIEEVRSLTVEQHSYRTVVIDSFTPLYDNAVDIGEKLFGNEWGKHIGHANKRCKALYGLLSQLDMNVIITAHAKNEYGDNNKVIGQTFDGWKKMDYLFDLVFALDRDPKNRSRRRATVRKTRLTEQFPDGDIFTWSIEELSKRYGEDKLNREATQVELAEGSLILTFVHTYNQLSEQEIKRLRLGKIDLQGLAYLPAERVKAGLDMMLQHLGK
ncbi:MAG: AAA family ATPase [Aestuariibacter sp.]|nr:AAA family ATPase [Aestuariibacter sp.]